MAAVVTRAVAAVLADAGRPLPTENDALDLDSLMVVALVDVLETQLPLRLRPQDVTASHFATTRTLTRLCAGRLAPG